MKTITLHLSTVKNKHKLHMEILPKSALIKEFGEETGHNIWNKLVNNHYLLILDISDVGFIIRDSRYLNTKDLSCNDDDLKKTQETLRKFYFSYQKDVLKKTIHADSLVKENNDLPTSH